MVLFFAVATTACLPLGSTPENSTESADELSEKSGFATLTGTLSQQPNAYILQTSTGPVTLQSFDVDLSSYIGQEVTVTGKYSGDELFVSEITQ